jgi:hypothetical protein
VEQTLLAIAAIAWKYIVDHVLEIFVVDIPTLEHIERCMKVGPEPGITFMVGVFVTHAQSLEGAHHLVFRCHQAKQHNGQQKTRQFAIVRVIALFLQSSERSGKIRFQRQDESWI